MAVGKSSVEHTFLSVLLIGPSSLTKEKTFFQFHWGQSSFTATIHLDKLASTYLFLLEVASPTFALRLEKRFFLRKL